MRPNTIQAKQLVPAAPHNARSSQRTLLTMHAPLSVRSSQCTLVTLQTLTMHAPHNACLAAALRTALASPSHMFLHGEFMQ
eukprot:1160691-Pelagomonas_calceolata.AAC.10